MKYIKAIIKSFRGFSKRDFFTLLGVIAPLIFVAIVATMFKDFVINAIEANVTINLGIILAGMFGVFLIVERLLDAQKDYRTIYRFGKEVREGANMSELLDAPWLRKQYVRQYLSHIAATRGSLQTQLEHSSIQSELTVLMEDYDSRMELPQFLVGFMIAMGLLGTFIGLLETLTGISGMLNGLGGQGDVQAQFMKLVVELRKPLAGMGIAFSASMFGLVTSLMLSIMMTNLRQYVRDVINLARGVMNELTTSTAVEGGAMTRKLEGGSSGVYQVAQMVEPQLLERTGTHHPNVSFQSSMEIFVKKIDVLVTGFTAQGESTRKLHDLLGVGPRMKETNEKSLEVLKLLSETAEEQQRTLQEVVSSVTALAENQRQLHNKQQSTMQSMLDVNTGMSRAVFSLLEAQRSAHAEQRADIQALTQVTSEVVRMGEKQNLGVQSLTEVSNGTSRALFSLLEAQRTAHTESRADANALRDVNGEIVRMAEKQNTSIQSLIEVSGGTSRAIFSLLESQRTAHTESRADTQSLAEVSTEIVRASEKQNASLQSLIEVQNSMGRALFSLLESQRATHTDQRADLQSLNDVTNELVRISTMTVDGQKQMRTDLTTQLRQVANQLTDLRDVEISGGRHLSDVKDSVVKMVDSLAMIDVIAGNVNDQSALFAQMVGTLEQISRDLSTQENTAPPVAL